MLLQHVVTARLIVSRVDHALRSLRNHFRRLSLPTVNGRLPLDLDLLDLALGDARLLQETLEEHIPGSQPPWIMARMIACDLSAFLSDLPESGLPIDPKIISRLETARKDAEALRAALAVDVVPAPAPSRARGTDRRTLGDEMRLAWQAAAAFHEAKRAGDVETIRDSREDLIDFSQEADHAQTRQFCARIVNDERQKSANIGCP